MHRLKIGIMLLFCALPLTAQDVTATLNGTVRDATGALLAGPALTLRNDVTGLPKTAQANSDGSFVFPDLLIGAYAVSVELKGFKSYRQNEIKLTAGQIRALGDIKMSVGELAETITV